MNNQEARGILANLEADYRDLDPLVLTGDSIPLVNKRIEALGMAISALQAQDSLIARLKAEATKRNVQYMRSGDRYLIGFVDGMRLARSIVDGSIDEPKYVYPSEGMSYD